MIHKKITTLRALALCALALGGMGAAHAQYVITGNTSTGGNVVTGSGLLFSTTSGDGFLTYDGDKLTLNLGSFIPSDFTDEGASIAFFSNNNTLINNGVIDGASDDEGFSAGGGVIFFNEGSLANETVVNHGSIFGQENDDAEFVGNALTFAGSEVDNVNVTNTGVIQGASNSFESFIVGSGINITSEEDGISNVTINNSGAITGGNDNDDAEFMSSGISIVAANGISNINISNSSTGNILGGDGNIDFGDKENDVFAMGNAILIVDENEGARNINGVGISNSGNIMGGNQNFSENENDFSDFALGNAIVIGSSGDVMNINISNSSTGLIEGGNDNEGGWVQGTGISIGNISGDEFDVVGSVSNVTINNSGNIRGGHDNEGSGEFGLAQGTGIAIIGGTSVSNVTINNMAGGNIIGGDENDEALDAGGGIYIGTEFDNGEGDNASVSNITINNSGKISGGSGNTEAFYVGAGIGIGNFETDETVSNVTINNSVTGSITGGNGNFFESFEAGSGIIITADTINGVKINNDGLIKGGDDTSSVNNQPEIVKAIDPGSIESDSYGGSGINIFANNMSNIAINNNFTGVISGGLGGGTGIDIESEVDPANIVINNHGLITGGDGDPETFNNTEGGDGIDYFAPDEETNIHINNYGWIKGGNGVPGGGGGDGIDADGNNIEINNWGVIEGGTGGQSIQLAGPGPSQNAIFISGAGNVLNLNGHSAVYGKITVEGPENSNVVNLNLSGISAGELASLKSQLASQGAGSGSDTNVTFTLRGVTYDIDPAIIKINLSSYQLLSLTPNQAAVGASLDSITSNPAPGTVLFNLYNAIDQSGNVPAAIEQLSPQPYQLYGDIALANANFLALTIDHRLDNVRDGSESVDTTGIGGSTSGLTSGLSKNDGKDGKGTVTTTPEPENRWGFFASGNGVFSDVDAHGGDLQDAGFTSEGVTLGLDGKFHENWVLGVLFNYEHTDADLDNQGSKADIDSYSGGVYAGYHNGGYYGNGLFAYTHNDYDSNRNILIPGFNEVAHGNNSGNQEELNLSGGYDFQPGSNLTWGPIVGLQYVHLDVDGFSETGAPGAGLAVGSQDVSSLRSTMGLQITYRKQVGSRMSFATGAHAAWQHEFLDDSRGISASFIGDPLVPFSVQTTAPQRDAALAGVSADLTVRDRYTFFFDYDVQAGQDSYLEHSLKGGLKISW